jgi:DNA-binding protein Fis
MNKYFQSVINGTDTHAVIRPETVPRFSNALLINDFDFSQEMLSRSWAGLGFSDISETTAIGRSGRGCTPEALLWGYGKIHETEKQYDISDRFNIDRINELGDISASKKQEKIKLSNGKIEYLTDYRNEIHQQASIQSQSLSDSRVVQADEFSDLISNRLRTEFQNRSSLEERLSNIDFRYEDKLFDSLNTKTQSEGYKRSSGEYYFAKRRPFREKELNDSPPPSSQISQLQRQIKELKEVEGLLNKKISELVESNNQTVLDVNQRETATSHSTDAALSMSSSAQLPNSIKGRRDLNSRATIHDKKRDKTSSPSDQSPDFSAFSNTAITSSQSRQGALDSKQPSPVEINPFSRDYRLFAKKTTEKERVEGLRTLLLAEAASLDEAEVKIITRQYLAMLQKQDIRLDEYLVHLAENTPALDQLMNAVHRNKKRKANMFGEPGLKQVSPVRSRAGLREILQNLSRFRLGRAQQEKNSNESEQSSGFFSEINQHDSNGHADTFAAATLAGHRDQKTNNLEQAAPTTLSAEHTLKAGRPRKGYSDSDMLLKSDSNVNPASHGKTDTGKTYAPADSVQQQYSRAVAINKIDHDVAPIHERDVHGVPSRKPGKNSPSNLSQVHKNEKTEHISTTVPENKGKKTQFLKAPDAPLINKPQFDMGGEAMKTPPSSPSAALKQISRTISAEYQYSQSKYGPTLPSGSRLEGYQFSKNDAGAIWRKNHLAAESSNKATPLGQLSSSPLVEETGAMGNPARTRNMLPGEKSAVRPAVSQNKPLVAANNSISFIYQRRGSDNKQENDEGIVRVKIGRITYNSPGNTPIRPSYSRPKPQMSLEDYNNKLRER